MLKTIRDLKREEIDIGFALLCTDSRSFVMDLVARILSNPEVQNEREELLGDLKEIGDQAYHTNFVGDSSYQEDGLGLSKLAKKGYRPATIDVVLDSLTRCQDLCGLIQQHVQEYRVAA